MPRPTQHQQHRQRQDDALTTSGLTLETVDTSSSSSSNKSPAHQKQHLQTILDEADHAGASPDAARDAADGLDPDTVFPLAPATSPKPVMRSGSTGSQSTGRRVMSSKKAPVFENDDSMTDAFLSGLRKTTQNETGSKSQLNCSNSYSTGSSSRQRNQAKKSSSARRSTHSVGSQRRYLEHDLSSMHDESRAGNEDGGAFSPVKRGRSKVRTSALRSASRSRSGSRHPTFAPDGRVPVKAIDVSNKSDDDTMRLPSYKSSSISKRPPSETTLRSMIEQSEINSAPQSPDSSFLPASVANRHRCIRAIIVLTLSIAAAVSATFTFLSIREAETESFETDFDHVSQQLIDNWQGHWGQTMSTLESTALSIVSMPMLAKPDSQWPFLQIPNFQKQADGIRKRGNFTFFAVLPLLAEHHEEERLVWEQYTAEHAKEWILPDGTDAQAQSATIRKIHSIDEGTGQHRTQPPDTGPYLPVWQHAPTDVSMINYNVKTDSAMDTEVSQALRSRTVIMSKMTMHQRSRHGPSSNIYFPMIGNDMTLRGMLLVAMNWVDYLYHPTLYRHTLTDDLPNSFNGVHVVLQNTCQQTTTFLIKDQQVRVADDLRDVHDSKYDGMEHITTAADIAAMTIETAVPWNTDYCPYSIHIYPTSEMEDRYTTSAPWVYASIVIIPFVFLTVAFLMYHSQVKRSQRELLASALRSHAIVSNVFPKDIQDRLMDGSGHPQGKNGKESSYFRSSTKSIGYDDRGNNDHTGRDYHDNTTNRSGDDLVMQLEAQKTRLERFMSTHSVSHHQGDHDDEEGTSMSFAGDVQSTVTNETRSRRNSMTNNNNNNNNNKSSTSLFQPMIRSPYPSKSNANVKAHAKAEMYPNTTILFADICGFTDWSSTRDPSQVFALLEAVYGAFDKLAEKHGVFKVETVGDCYVSATGLPNPQPDHAIIMSRFAAGILQKMSKTCEKLEGKLGPDTTDLSLRVGIHSGPVAGGVLQNGGKESQMARFQLFGDTVNMASRMETCGQVNRIQCSKDTADLLVAAGKGSWLKMRKELVAVKGKGSRKTFWLSPKDTDETSTTPDLGSFLESDRSVVSQAVSEDFSKALSASDVIVGPPGGGVVRSANFQRLVNWNVELLSQQLKRIIAQNRACADKRNKAKMKQAAAASRNQGAGSGDHGNERPDRATGKDRLIGRSVMQWGNPRNEYVECIPFPVAADATGASLSSPSSPGADSKDEDDDAITPDRIEIDEKVDEQLCEYVNKIACSYQLNTFHCFEHACHVTMCVHKMLKRMALVETTSDEQNIDDGNDFRRLITKDPLTCFACIFAALIHDVDHPGVPNGQLVREKDEMAILYGNKSIAEQNSIDLAWGLLMDSNYSDLRRCLFANDGEKRRFRQLLVNLVVATDLFDADLKLMRKEKWQKAFGTNDQADSATDADANTDSKTTRSHLRATVVLENMMQAADIAHTMQFWNVYKKWNKKFFQEMYSAFKSGRLASDPTRGWYNGELWFFDNCVLPLATKMEHSKLFGGDADEELLKNASANREEWEKHGKELMKEMIREVDQVTSQ